MDLLLVTTGDNNVRRALANNGKFNLRTIDLETISSKVMFIDTLRKQLSVHTDVLLTYRCRFIVPEDILTMISGRGYNIHPSLLPKYAGTNPWEEIMANRESANGVTLHRLGKDIDAGEIVEQLSYRITDNDTVTTARSKADDLAAKMIIQYFTGSICNSKDRGSTDVPGLGGL